VNESLAQARGQLLSSAIPILELNAALVESTDSWLTKLFNANTTDQSNFALVAVGGLGRAELSFGSDLDLVLIHTPASSRTAAELAERIWYPIWDSGVGLDHSVRTVQQTLDVAQADLRALFGMLDLRLIAGSESLAAELKSKILQLWRKSFPKRITEIIEADQRRHQMYGDLAHLQSPNLKEAQGGLRDLVTLGALSKSWQVEVGMANLRNAQQVLMNTRTALHIATGKKTDLLTQDLQSDVAQIMGYFDSDALLKDIYQAARQISFSYRSAIRTAENLSRSTGLFGRRKSERVPIGDGLVVADGAIQFAIGHIADDALPLKAAVAAAESKLPINSDSLIELAKFSQINSWQVRHRELLTSFLGAGEGLLETWEALDHAGIISNWVPHWDAVRCAPQRNSVHLYTVDRHLVQTTVEASKLTSNVARPDILLIASLLHDIGKARSEDHSVLGARLTAEITLQLGYKKTDRELIELLVRHHLLLPETATRRDLEDPATILAVQNIVQTPDTLNLLHQLAIADALATSPIAASKWRLGLIDQLVSKVTMLLTGEAISAEPELNHFDIAVDDIGIGLSLEPGTDEIKVRVIAPDAPGLLAVIAGLFSLHRLIVRSAKTKTVSTTAMSQWQLQPLFGDAPTEAFLRSELRRALTGAIDVSALLSERERTALQRIENLATPKVLFPQASTTATVVEVRVHDGPAMLHRIAAAISTTGIDIVAAHISTLGASADDVFYLRNSSGEPLTAAEQQQVARAILDAISIG
jgi:[protein-PII] uridylyltransferase